MDDAAAESERARRVTAASVEALKSMVDNYLMYGSPERAVWNGRRGQRGQ